MKVFNILHIYPRLKINKGGKHWLLLLLKIINIISYLNIHSDTDYGEL